MFTALKRVFRWGWQSFSRDGEIAVATIFILFLSIVFISSLFLFKEGRSFLISSLQEKIDVSVYFKEETAEDKILDIKKEISAIPEVKEVNYVSQEAALADFTERHKEDPVLMESIGEVGGNPFLASLNIKAWQPDEYASVVNFFETPDLKNLIEKVDYSQRKPIIERVFSLTSIINKTGLVLAIILVVLAILVTFNTVRLSIYNFGEEIKIQRLVGASNWLIRGPFLVQGAISGLIAILLCLLVLAVVLWYLSPKVEYFFPGLNFFDIFVKNLGLILLVQFAAGVFLGMVPSAVAIRKYLKV